MKQIKDVEVLKDAIHAQCFQGADDGDNVAYKIESIIDSLAVEVPEAKSGAIDSLIGLVQATCSEQMDFDTAEAARAELAQLQADRDHAVADNVKLRTEIVHSDKRDIAIKISNQETEIKNLKGALRTLAVRINCDKCPCNINCSYDVEGERECFGFGADKIIAYALANPTEEVEG